MVKRKARKIRVVYMAHPVSGDVEANLARAKRWYKWITDNYKVGVVADWIINCEIYDDSNPADREAGLLVCEEIASRCDEIWLVGGVVSNGMAREAEAAEAAGVTVVDLSAAGAEPPEGKI